MRRSEVLTPDIRVPLEAAVLLSVGLHIAALTGWLAFAGLPGPAPHLGEDETAILVTLVDEPPPAEPQATPQPYLPIDVITPVSAPPEHSVPTPPDQPVDDVSSEPVSLEPAAIIAEPDVEELPVSRLDGVAMPRKPSPPISSKTVRRVETARPGAAVSVAAASPGDQPVRPRHLPSGGEPSAAGRAAVSTGAGERATPVTFPSYLNNPAPPYPQSELRRRREGLVLLEVHVTSDGRAGRVSISQSSGIKAFDRAALRTVNRWRFVPARRNGRAIAADVRVPIRFSLRVSEVVRD